MAAQKAQKLLSMLDNDSKPPPKPSEVDEDDIWMQVDGAGSGPSKATKPKVPAPMKKPVPIKQAPSVHEQSDDEEVVRPAAGRKPRAVAAKPVKYDALSASESDGDDMLFNVGNMVKGINTTTTNPDTSRPLFAASASRPSSSHGHPRRPTSSNRQTIDVDADDTDYSKLAPPTTKKNPVVTARQTIISDDEDSLDDMPVAKVPQPNADRPKEKAKPKAKAATKKAAPAPAPKAALKQTVLSPAAKAYAAKRAKAEKAAREANKEDLDVDDVANEILDDDDEEVTAGRGRAKRAAAAAPKKRYALSDDEDPDDNDNEESYDFNGEDSDF